MSSALSILQNEWQGGSSSEVFHFHGGKNAALGPEIGSTLSVTKRSNSDSAYMGLVRDRMLPVGSDSLESLCRRKMFGKEVVSEQLGRSHDDELMIAMRPPRPTSHISHPPVSSRPDSLIRKWEQSMPANPGQMAHYPSHFAQGGTYVDKVSSSCAFKDASAGGTIISQTVADEGSRTGIKGSGTVNIINLSSGAGERNSTAVLPCGNRPKAPQAIVPESRNIPRRTTVSASWQMTIFYAGQAHVFDDVLPNKADLIMALAGSNGGSWSTSYFPTNEAKAHIEENEIRTNNVVSSMHGGLDHGHSQVARIPFTSDLSSLMPGNRR